MLSGSQGFKSKKGQLRRGCVGIATVFATAGSVAVSTLVWAPTAAAAGFECKNQVSGDAAGATAIGDYDTACGFDANANGSSATAFGSDSQALNAGVTAIGG